jgi:hypothetical protein
MAFTIHPNLASRLKSSAVSLLPLWAFVACSRIKFTFFNFITKCYTEENYLQKIKLALCLVIKFRCANEKPPDSSALLANC